MAGGLALLGCTGILGSFDVAPDGTDGMDGATAEGSTTDGSSSDGNTPGVDAAKPLMCKSNETKCVAQGVCAVLTTNQDNCGACGHSCGGGMCTGGVCQSAKIYDCLLYTSPSPRD